MAPATAEGITSTPSGGTIKHSWVVTLKPRTTERDDASAASSVCLLESRDTHATMGTVLVLTTAPTYRHDLVGQDTLMLIAGKQGGIEGDRQLGNSVP